MPKTNNEVELLELGKDMSYVRMNGKEVPIQTKKFINNILKNIKELNEKISKLEKMIDNISPLPDVI